MARNILGIVWLAFVMMLAYATQSYAGSCSLAKPNFGINQAQLKKAFNLNTLDVATTGEGIITIGGKEACDILPERSMVEFILLDDTFVQMRIKGADISGELYTIANKSFGERDNVKKNQSKAKKVTHGLWKKDNKYNVIYSAYTQGKHNFERIVITSSKHSDLFDKQNTLDDQAAVDEEKAKKEKAKK